MRHRTPAGLRGSGRAARARASRPRAPLALPALDVGAALRARLGARPRAVVLMDYHGPLTGGELLDLVRLQRSGTATADRAGLPALPAEAPLRQVLAAVLAGPDVLELRSSGSTGAPRPQRRGPLSPAQLLSLADLARRIGLRPGRVTACAAPGVHGHGLVATLGALTLGAPLVDLTHLPAAERIALLHRTSPALLTGVPVHLADLLRADRELGGGRPLAIDRVVAGSDVLSPVLRADLARHFRARVHDVYGTTETGSLCVDGRPLHGVHLRELDGLLCARTPFTGGRELVTDRGEITADGRVRVLGRADGSVSSGGMLHDPAATVRVLRSAPGVASARLQVVPDARFGVRTLAEVVLAPVATDAVPPSAGELRSLVRDRLGAAAVPREVRFLPPGAASAAPSGPDGEGSAPSGEGPSGPWGLGGPMDGPLSSPGR
ncbi:AMP-binding protein [Brachybacterium sp. GU-2]|uniref:AMP-binding protein n=1 Tax=Brachybacterium sp. GU-2 TaxID=3069708 RepID=UPI00298CD02B|nr:AMP-binding protein [Brachybacterium sp. GU-2]WME23889.2 AMP-binding protein [Brachybacterium sp. GU-2]